MPRRRRLVSGAAVAVLALVVTGASSMGAGPLLQWRVFAYNVPKAVSIIWTGKQFLYVENTQNRIWKAPAAGGPITLFGKMPTVVEETRCVRSPGTHGFPRGVIFCHSPDHKIYEFSADGKRQTVFASLPTAYPPADDGALVFDDVGRFGYRLIAATGRSGAAQPAGGTVYAVNGKGQVQTIGTYSGPGGADEVAIAPPSFGDVGGEALLTVDAGTAGGQLVAVASDGTARSLVTFPDGPNPIVRVTPVTGRASAKQPAPGLYVTNDLAGYVYYAPVSSLQAFKGDLLVGSEGKALFWIVEPRSGGGFATVPVASNLGQTKISLEGMTLIR